MRRNAKCNIGFEKSKSLLLKTYKRKFLRKTLLIVFYLIVPSLCFAQGQQNALEFFGTILHVLLFLFIILPLIFFTYKRIKTGRFLFSVFTYILAVTAIAFLGYSTYDSLFDPYESMDTWSFVILIYFIFALASFILTLKSDILKYKR